MWDQGKDEGKDKGNDDEVKGNGMKERNIGR